MATLPPVCQRQTGRRLTQYSMKNLTGTKNEMKEIVIITTGGTIQSSKDAITGSKFSSQLNIEIIHTLRKTFSKLCFKHINLMSKLSEDMEPKDWLLINREVNRQISNNNIIGVIILHGTFTMSFSASALRIMNPDPSKTIIFTGTQTSPDISLDEAVKHLICATYTIVKIKKPEILIVFSNNEENSCFIYNPLRTRKLFSWESMPFLSQKEYIKGKITTSGEIYWNDDEKTPVPIENKLFIPAYEEEKLDINLLILQPFPGIDFNNLKVIDSASAILIEGYADGAIFASQSNLDFIKKLTKRNIPVFFTSKSYGDATLVEYRPGREVIKNGGIPLGDMLTEAAIVKLILSLPWKNKFGIEWLTNVMRANISGEITPKSWTLRSRRKL